MANRQHLLDLLRTATAQLAILDTILDTEYAQLVRRDPNAYGPVMERKLAAVEQASRLEVQIRSELGLQAGAHIHESLATAVRQAPELGEDWQQFVELVKRCADKNMVNGSIVNSKRASINRLIQILQGGDYSLGVYGPDAKVSENVDTVCRATA